MWIQKLYEVKYGQRENKNHAFICGAFSGIIATASVHPLDLLRTRMALRINDFNVYKTLILEIYKNEGMKYFFRGLYPNLMGIFLYKGISFYFFENLLSHFTNTGIIQKSHFLQFVSAAIASLSAQIITYPFDVLKRRYMVIHDRINQFCY